MTRAHTSAVSPLCAHRRACPARSLAPCATHPRTSDSPFLGHTRWVPGRERELRLSARLGSSYEGGKRLAAGAERRSAGRSAAAAAPEEPKFWGSSLATRRTVSGDAPPLSLGHVQPCFSWHGSLPTTACASHPRSGRHGPSPVRPPDRGPEHCSSPATARAPSPAPDRRAGGLQREGPEEPAYASTGTAATLWEAGKGGPERRPPNVQRNAP